ncbi:hypothetical protein LCGC14_3064790, partial [marine sediment metagenome]
MKEEIKNSAVDLTDLAISIVVLGVIVSIGGSILITYRDTRLTDLDTISTANETADFSTLTSKELANGWFKSITSVLNTSDGATIDAGNYSVSTNAISGKATIVNLTADMPWSWNITYDSYDTSRADWDVTDKAAAGLGEYGNWFKILVIVGVAAVVL